jgi:hypothetical protein
MSRRTSDSERRRSMNHEEITVGSCDSVGKVEHCTLVGLNRPAADEGICKKEKFDHVGGLS